MQGMNPPPLVLLCPFAKANWHGSPLAVHTSGLNNTYVQHWIGTILLKYEGMDQDMHYHQAIFITLWTIWTQKPGGPCFNNCLILLIRRMLTRIELTKELEVLGSWSSKLLELGGVALPMKPKTCKESSFSTVV